MYFSFFFINLFRLLPTFSQSFSLHFSNLPHFSHFSANHLVFAMTWQSDFVGYISGFCGPTAKRFELMKKNLLQWVRNQRRKNKWLRRQTARENCHARFSVAPPIKFFFFSHSFYFYFYLYFLWPTNEWINVLVKVTKRNQRNNARKISLQSYSTATTERLKVGHGRIRGR